MRRSLSFSIIGLGFLCLTGFSPQIALPTFQGAQARSQSDSESPIITITATDGSNAVANNSTTNDATLSLTFTANESATGFAIGDIGTFGGSVSSFSGSGSSYTATFTPSGERNTGIYLPKDTYTDLATNNNRGSLPFYWRYDATAPTIVSGTSVASDNSTVTVKLSEPVYDTNSGSGALEVGDFAFSISGGSATLSSSTPNSISKANSSFTARTIATPDGPVDITYYDLDLDNDIDIIVTLYDGDKILWYENDGSQSFTERTIDASLDGPRDLWPIDLDLDGDIDIVQAVQGADGLFWYENNGSQSFTKNTIDGSPSGSARYVSVGDIDGDGDLDISLTTYSSSNFAWYENNGSQSFTKNTISTDGHTFPVLIDLDEDGDLDFVSHINNGSNNIGWYENDGSENFTQNIIANDYGAQIAVADLDDDGDYDIIGADYTNGHINWYANNGSESFTKNTIDNSGMTNAWDIEVGDVDGDGDLDVVGMASTNNSTADDKIVWYINNGSESFTEYDVDTDLNHPYKFRMTDIDNDGDLDMMVVARGGDQVIWYENVDAGYVLGLSLSGTPSGAETVTVTPASSAIFDVAGNAASTSQSNNTVTLNDQRVTMAITAVNGSSSAVSDGST
ncbi:MAG: FG-GAP-like repeat-containing protein, partial [Candidatus Neomarinimicrobiota bacterium]